jgi:hypothetical protein
MSNDKHQILEPITAVARLITLAFKPKNTKIAIRDHNVVLCEPKHGDTYYGMIIPQSVDRYWNGDSREDIYVLNHVICNFIEWYIIPYKNTEAHVDIYKGLLNMANYLRVGLKELQNTYKSGTAVGTLQYYIIVLTAVIEGWFRHDMLYAPSSSGRESFLDNDGDGDSLIYSTIFDVEKFKHFWSNDELKSLCTQFDTCFKHIEDIDKIVFKDDTEDGLIGSIDIIVNSDIDNNNLDTTTISNNIHEDTQSKKSTNSNNCSLNVSNTPFCHEKPLPVPKSQTNVIVKSQLIGINNILSLMDKRFTTMLSHSVKGIH